MPTPSDTLHAIRGAAEVNSAALSSIENEIPTWLTAIDGWNPTSMKTRVRDQLARTLAAYENAKQQAARLVIATSQAIDELGTGGDPDVLPPSTPWSTGELQVAVGVATRPSAAKELGRYLVVENITWDATISAGRATVPATAQADVTYWSNGVPLAIFRWQAGDLEAEVIILDEQSAPDDVIVVLAPGPQDATLSGIACTLVGRRRGT